MNNCSRLNNDVLNKHGKYNLRNMSAVPVQAVSLDCRLKTLFSAADFLCMTTSQLNSSYQDKYFRLNKNLAIANRSCISCAHNTLRASIGLNITPWPWKKGSLKVTGNETIGYIIHDLLLVELGPFDAKYYRDLEMWVRGHSRSLKVVPFESLGAVSYSRSIVTIAISLAISEIFSVKEWPDLKIWVSGHSRSSKMAWFDRPWMNFY